MFKRKYKYHIAYNFKDAKGFNGFGSCTNIRSDKLDTHEKITAWSEQYKKECDFAELIVLNIIPLKG